MRKLTAILFGAAVVGMSGSAIAQTTAPSTTTKEAKEKRATAKKDLQWKAMDIEQRRHDLPRRVHEVSRNGVAEGEAERQGTGHGVDVDAAYAAGTVPSAIPGQPTEKAKP